MLMRICRYNLVYHAHDGLMLMSICRYDLVYRVEQEHCELSEAVERGQGPFRRPQLPVQAVLVKAF